MFAQLLLFIRIGTSMKRRIRRQLRANYPALFSPLHRKLRPWLHHELNSWRTKITIPLAVLSLLFLAANCRPSFLSFVEVDKNFVTTLDQRLANAVTFLSGCLAVLAWFYSNLGIKEPHGFRLVFRHAYLNTIFFYMVSVIVAMISISAFRKEFSKETLLQLILTVHYLFAIAFVILAVLFIEFKKIIDSKHLIRLYGKEFMADARREFYQQQLAANSKMLYTNTMESLQFQQTAFHFGPNPAADHRGILLTSDHDEVEYVITDVNLWLLAWALRPFARVVNYFDALEIGHTLQGNEAPWMIDPAIVIPRWRRWLIRQSIVYRKKRRAIAADETAQSILEKKLADYVAADDTEHAQYILQLFQQAYFHL